MKQIKERERDMRFDEDFMWVQKWFYQHCDGDWEQENQIKIRTTEYSEWVVTINIDETELKNKDFHELKIEKSENDWLECFIKNHKFIGRCGSLNLPDVFYVFRDWAEKFERSF